MGWGSPLPAGRVLVDARAGRGVGWPDKPASASDRNNTGRRGAAGVVAEVLGRGAGLVVYPGVRR